MTAPAPTSRRALLGALALLPLVPVALPRPALAQPFRRRVVTVLGDSITAGYGLPASLALPAQLQLQLDRLGAGATVRNAGISGDTTAGGLRRLDASVAADTAVCVVALGGNDLLNGLPPAQTRANLTGIVRRLKARGVTVVLAGVRAPELFGGPYIEAFNASFVAVAGAERVPFLPSLLEGVALRRELNQPDGIHPNAAGVRVIASRLAPLVAGALRLRA